MYDISSPMHNCLIALAKLLVESLSSRVNTNVHHGKKMEAKKAQLV